MAAPARASRRLMHLAVAALLVLTTASLGVAWAAGGVSRAKPFQVSATYTVTAQAGAPAREIELLRIGDAVLFARCEAALDPNPEFGLGVGVVLGVRNVGSDPLLVTLDNQGTAFQNVWLQPGTQDAHFWAGQAANESGNYGDVQRFAIFDFTGRSATGLVGMAASRDVTPGAGSCIFTAQAKG